MSKPIDAVLIYPQLGSFDNIIRDIPLSLIYAAAASVRQGYHIRIVDLRLDPNNWKQKVDEALSHGCRLVGLSVMTGNPIKTSLAVSQYVKERYDIPIVWGGAHPTILPEQTLANPLVDYVIRDWGSIALCQLIAYLRGDGAGKKEILGLGYKEKRKIFLNPVQCSFEMIDFHDLPYHLVDIDGNNYNRLNNGEVVFPIYTAMGCPYKCSFCMAPAVYKKIQGKKWIAHGTEFVLGHIEYLLERYRFQRLQIYDDDAFVDLERMHALLSEFVKRGYHRRLRIDFRGARINELDKMDEKYLSLMETAGVEMLAIGAESGSNDMLKKMNKGITVEQIIRVNRKLARFPKLRPHYNFFCGIPGETMASLEETKHLLLQLIKDNPKCFLGVGADWKPLPGSVMTEDAVRKWGLRLPDRLERWADIDSYDAKKIVHPWYSNQMNNMIKLLQIAGQFLDGKVNHFKTEMGPVLGRLLSLSSICYRPILKWRLRHNCTRFMVESDLTKALFNPLMRLFFGRRLFK